MWTAYQGHCSNKDSTASTAKCVPSANICSQVQLFPASDSTSSPPDSDSSTSSPPASDSSPPIQDTCLPALDSCPTQPGELPAFVNMG